MDTYSLVSRHPLLAILRKGLVDIPLMFILNNTMPIYGIVWATPIADVICCVTAIAFFASFMRQHADLLSDQPVAGMAQSAKV